MKWEVHQQLCPIFIKSEIGGTRPMVWSHLALSFLVDAGSYVRHCREDDSLRTKQNWLCLPSILYRYFESNNTDAKCIRNYRFDMKPVWVRCSGNCFPVQAWKNIISNKRFVSGKSLHFVGILEAWKTSFLSNTNLPQGGTQKISEKAKERKTHYQILRGFQRPTLPLHLQN